MDASNTMRYRMAAEAVAEILSQKLEMLLSHPVRTRCLLMESLAKEAKEELATIQKFFSTQDRLSQSTEWLGPLLKAMYDAEDFIDKFHLREARGRHEVLHMATRPPAALISKYKLWRDLSNLVNKMQKLCQDQCWTGKEAKGKTRKGPACSSSPDGVPGQGKQLARLTSFWDRQASMIFLWREEKKIIMEQIRKVESRSECGVTSILGEQGTGKTFLARWVYREAMYLGFKWRAWVRLSASMDMKEFLFEIRKQTEKLAIEEDYMNSNERTKMPSNELPMTNILVVLDDVHLSNEPFLQKLVKDLYHGSNYIITTTQDESVAKIMSNPGAGPIKLSELDLKKIREMLDSKLHRVPNGQGLSNEEGIPKTCQSLPLHISLLSGLLPNAGEQAKNGSKMSLPDLLQLSYHRLPVHLKPCFIYMALFPLAPPIPIRKLVRLWLAEGLLDAHCYGGGSERTKPPEEVAETFILELADRNVIDVVSWRADGSPKACQMLTSMYDMIHPIARSTGFIHIYAASKSKDKNNRYPTGQQQQLPGQPRETKVRWLAEHMNIVRDNRSGSYPSLNLGHVYSFLSFYLRRDISTVLRNMTCKTNHSFLRVLDLEGVYKPSLQGVLHKLVLLKYLGLRSTVLDSIPSAVADLQYLETLDIKDTNITSLPNSFWKARNLRHLHLNWFCINLNNILKACGNNVMALAKLQTLSGLVTGEVHGDLMTGHVNSMTTLTTLKLFLQHLDRDTSGAAWEIVGSWISFRLTNLRSLTLGVFKKKPLTWIGPIPELLLAGQHHDLLKLYLLGKLSKPIWTQLLPGSLRVLTLSGSRVKIDMMSELGGLLRNLRTFRLLANSFLGSSLRFLKDGFPSLMILKIWKLPRLMKVIIEQGAMQGLKELEFRHLDRLKDVEGIKECEKLETICEVVKKGAYSFVDSLKKGNEVTMNLHKIEDTDTPECTDNDDSCDEDEDEDQGTYP